MSALDTCFDLIGKARWIKPNKPSIFGTRDYLRLRVDIIAAPDVLKKWTVIKKTEKGRDKHFLFEGRNSHSRSYDAFVGSEDIGAPHVLLTDSKVLSNMAHLFTEMENVKFSWKNTYEHQLLKDTRGPGDFGRWARAVQAADKDFEQFRELVSACEGDPVLVEATLDRARQDSEPQSFHVPGLIPRGVVTLLLGNKKVGKSAIALELAVNTALRRQKWLGFSLDTSFGRFAVYLFGEDSEGAIVDRVKRMTGDAENPILLHTIPMNGADIDSVLAGLKKQKVALLVVDPARKCFLGDEDGSDAVSAFFTKLERFARQKNCAVLVLHHLKRNASPRTLAEVATVYRGSSVFLDRPRVTLAMLRIRDETHFGIPSQDGTPLHNFLESTMFSGVRRLRRDEGTFRHVPIDAKPSSAPNVATMSEIDTVLAAAKAIVGSGKRLTRTGKTGLFECKLSELAGMSRAAVRAIVDQLIGQGLLNTDEGGVLTLPELPVYSKHDKSDLALADLLA
jgi:AAA domain